MGGCNSCFEFINPNTDASRAVMEAPRKSRQLRHSQPLARATSTSIEASADSVSSSVASDEKPTFEMKVFTVAEKETTIVHTSSPEKKTSTIVEKETSIVHTSSPEEKRSTIVKKETAIVHVSAPEEKTSTIVEKETAIAHASAPEEKRSTIVKKETAIVHASAPEENPSTIVEKETAIAHTSAPEESPSTIVETETAIAHTSASEEKQVAEKEAAIVYNGEYSVKAETAEETAPNPGIFLDLKRFTAMADALVVGEPRSPFPYPFSYVKAASPSARSYTAGSNRRFDNFQMTVTPEKKHAPIRRRVLNDTRLKE